MNKEQGFSLKPETYNQKEWYELFMNLSKEYRKKCNIINEIKEYLKYQVENLNFEKDTKAKMLGSMILVMLDKEELKEE